MITSEKIDQVVRTFERVLPFAQHEDALDMEETDVSRRAEYYEADDDEEHFCGTTHCHGGWYSLAKHWDLKSKFLGGRALHDFLSGGRAMAEDLGFKSMYHLRYWAEENPKIWGNDKGALLFDDNKAFNYEGKLTLAKIVDHWRGVSKRLKEKEGPSLWA